MPSSIEFAQAALKFAEAAELVADLVIDIDGLDTSEVLRGGRLGDEIPAGINAASAMARRCQDLLESAAAICEQRSLIMADYEIELAVFDEAVDKYNEAWADWNYKIGLGKDIAHPDVVYPMPLNEPVWNDGLAPLVGAAGSVR